MSGPSESSPLPGVSTAFGALELNVFIAGLEAVVWLAVLRATIFGASIVPTPPDDWKWWFVVVGALAIFAIFLLGLLVEGLAGKVRHWVAGTDERPREWFLEAVQPPAEGWGQAQRWMWKSPQAAAEFSRRRLRILVARNSAFNSLVLMLALAAFIVVRRPSLWLLWLIVDVVAGLVLAWLFGYVWISALKAWNKAVRDAGEMAQSPDAV